MNTFLSLDAAFDPPVKNREFSAGEKRVKEFVSGFESFFTISKGKIPSSTTSYVVDNTVLCSELLDKRIDEVLTKYQDQFSALLFTGRNQYGWRNKGAGLIDKWLWLEEEHLLDGMDWFLHYEPRQSLRNWDFFGEFYKNPRNLFCVNRQTPGEHHFNTGILAMETSTMLRFARSVNLEEMIANSVGIEYALYNWFSETGTPFGEVPKMGITYYPPNGPEAETGIEM